MPTWKARSLKTGYEWEGVLVAHWEPNLVTSEKYNDNEFDADDALQLWAKGATEMYSDGLVPIYLSARCIEKSITETMPFQHNHHNTHQSRWDFLNSYTWPEDSVTGEPLNWLTLPVMDKLWDSEHRDDGGFIQSATGWKPSVLQPYLYLPALTRAVTPG